MEKMIQGLDARFIHGATPGELRRAIRQLGLRDVIDGRRFDPIAFIEGQYGFEPAQILSAARLRLHWRTQHLCDDDRLRVRYFFQAQLSPQPVRNAIHEKGLSALTILPGFERQHFPLGTVYLSINALQLLTLTMQRWRPNDIGTLTDHFDVKLHVMELDRTEGVVHIGGSYMVKSQPYGRTRVSRDFSREPGQSPQAVPKNRFDVIDAALAAHELLETTAVSEMGYQQLPVLPKLYLGFRSKVIPCYDTPALRRSAMSHVVMWMRKGLVPELGADKHVSWQYPVILKLRTVDPDSLEDWTSLYAILGEEDSEALLVATLRKSIVEHQDKMNNSFYLAQLAFFPQSAIKEVINNVGDVFARVDDHLGWETFTPDGEPSTDYRYGKIQVMQLAQNLSEVGGLHLNLDSTELGKEGEFAPSS